MALNRTFIGSMSLSLPANKSLLMSLSGPAEDSLLSLMNAFSISALVIKKSSSEKCNDTFVSFIKIPNQDLLG